ncbi:phosphohydrolase [Leptolyngbya sp. 'hensonii']|uniref:HD domain-containing protein n=1 Tax=Leptolyngbya sp. 'hensonii' TaxID=1922337 RepID=UPI00094F8271|nr:HD domain-containing protein [Leptolyngbya sp. 'hensonii']OLP19121.1 phosphohydrolase [Leptolyngbya sp. 'hensonii']
MLPNASRTYHDPLHGAITLDSSDPTEALLIRLIDTPEFQRLRRIRQLGPASLTFHGAESSRFTHSVGVLAVARRAFDRLAKRYPQLQIYRPVVLCAALLHDLGHGPFSHTSEEIFGNHHEAWTRRILKESPPIHHLLTAFDPNLVQGIEAVYLKKHPVPLVWQLVSSQLDCDRLDYLLRDSYFTGASYGRLDLDRILLAMDYDPVSQQLVVARKGMAAIEHYLLVRYFMYAQVYNHPKNLAASWSLTQAFQRAGLALHQGHLAVDETVMAWLSQDCNTLPLEHYLSADDTVFSYHLHRWQNCADPILADLSRRLIQRDLLKAIDVTHLEEGHRQALLQQVYSGLTLAGFSPQYYAGLRVALSRGYTLYQRGIKLRAATGLQEISEQSTLVKALIQPFQRVWLFYPREVQSAVEIAVQACFK